MTYLKDICIGIILIILGVYTIIDVNKSPDSQLKSVTAGRYMSGLGAIILGFLLIIGLVHW